MCSKKMWDKLRQKLYENNISYVMPIKHPKRVYFFNSTSFCADDRVVSMSLGDVENHLNKDDIDYLVILVTMQLTF